MQAAAKKLTDGLVDGLAHEIPAGDFEPGDGAVTALAVVKRHEGCLRKDALEIEGVLAEKHGGNFGLDQGLRDGPAQRFTQAAKAIVGVHLDDQPGPICIGAPGPANWRNEGQVDDGHLDLGNLHGAASLLPTTAHLPTR
jgi:hypothetical protein